MHRGLFQLPDPLDRSVRGYARLPVVVGESRAAVYYLTAPGRPTLYLKMARKSEENVRAEAQRMAWLAPFLPVPRIVEIAEDDERVYLLMSALPGFNAADDLHRADLSGLVRLLAEGLRAVHAVPAAGCPFDQRLSVDVGLAAQRLQQGRVDESGFDPERQGRRAHDLFQELLATQPRDEDVVFTHGDYCLPNVIVHKGRLSGFVDLGRAGLGDRYRDLALASRSLAYNWGPEWVPRLFAEYGIEHPDERRLAFYRLLDEFF